MYVITEFNYVWNFRKEVKIPKCWKIWAMKIYVGWNFVFSFGVYYFAKTLPLKLITAHPIGKVRAFKPGIRI